MSNDMKLIMESWRTKTLIEREGTQEYSRDYIKQIQVGEFIKFVLGDKKISEITKLARLFFDTQRVKRAVQILSSLLTRGGIGALVGIIVAIDLFATGGTASTAAFLLASILATQYTAEFLENLFVKEMERKIGFNDEITDYKPKELEMVFGVDDEIIRLMRGGDAAPGTQGNTEMAQEFTRQALVRLKVISKNIFKEITPELEKLQTGLTPTVILQMMVQNPERLNREMQFASEPTQRIRQFLQRPITDFIEIEDTFTEMAIKIIQKQIDNKEYPVIIPQYAGGKK